MVEEHYLTPLFEPKSVAVIRRLTGKNSVGSVIFRNMLDAGYKGRLFAVNPKHSEGARHPLLQDHRGRGRAG